MDEIKCICGCSFKFSEIEEVAMGAVKCPKCERIYDQEGTCLSKDKNIEEIKPFRFEHSARLKSPDMAHIRIRRTSGSDEGTVQGVKIPKSIDVIWFIIKSDGKEVPIAQALRFPTKTWTVSAAKKWLKDKDIKFINFEAASKEMEINMEKKHIDVPFIVKSVDENDKFFHFSGLASTFGNIDRTDDIIERGAFVESINQMKRENQNLPILWQHKIDMPLGIYIDFEETEKGLEVRGRMPKSDTFVSGRVIPQMKVGSITKMSIGFTIKDAEFETIDEENIRVIKKVILWEVSLVTIPANPKADIIDMKAADLKTIKDISNFLKQHGITKNETEHVLANLRKFIKEDQGNLDSNIRKGNLEEYSELNNLINQTKNLLEILKGDNQ